MDPPSKFVTKLVNKNAINSKSMYPPKNKLLSGKEGEKEIEKEKAKEEEKKRERERF